MLTEVKNQLKVTALSIKYGIMREMLNKTTFLTNVLFMILNNASFIIQWVVLYSLKENIGGYAFKEILLLWGLAAATYGVSHFFFKSAYSLSDTINNGKLDSYIVQPKNVLISSITSSVEPSAMGDMLFGIIMLFIYGTNIKTTLLFILFSITGGLTMTSVSVILSSLAFWFNKSDIITDTGNSLVVNFATYPDGIFKGAAKILLFTLIPVGFINYIPLKVLTGRVGALGLISIGVCILFIILAFLIFYRGLKRYSSTNLMIAKI